MLQTEQKWKELEQKLDNYQNTLSLNLHKSDEVSNILNLSLQQLQQLTAEDCGIYGYLLVQYSTFLQKEINRHHAKNKWASHNLDAMTGKYGKEYGNQWTKLDERKLMLISDNSYAKALFDLIKHSSVICEDLTYIAKKVEIMATQLSELQKTKRYTHEKVRTT